MRVNRVEDGTAWVDDAGTERSVSLLCVEGVEEGEYVLVHAGLALTRLAPGEAAAILSTLAEVAG
jgi:hydrogenase expression/formation protein HypC